MARPRRHRTGALIFGWTAGIMAVFAGLVWVIARELNTTHPVAVVEGCKVESDGVTMTLATDQADNAALITAMTLRRGLPARAATIALATAIQESKLRNIDYGDRDSLGLFQQRPSQGWGNPEQILDPTYSTGVFLDHLVTVVGWETMEVTDAAQAVQRSGYPDAYADHESGARIWASALTGWSPQTLTCTLDTPEKAGSADALIVRVDQDLGLSAFPTADAIEIDPSGLGADTDRMAWAVAQWAVAVADEQQIVAVQFGNQQWTRAGSWQTVDTTTLGSVRVTLAT